MNSKLVNHQEKKGKTISFLTLDCLSQDQRNSYLLYNLS